MKLVASQAAEEAAEAALVLLEGEADSFMTWDESMQMSVTEIRSQIFGKCFIITVSDLAGEVEEELIARLEKELGRPIADCIVQSEHKDRPHPEHPGSRCFDLVTVYSG